MDRISGEFVELTFHITDNCNLRCTYCYQQHSACGGVLKLDDAKKLLDQVFLQKLGQDNLLKDYIAKKFDFVILRFIGGEVTLYMNLVKDICDYFFRKANEFKLYGMAIKSYITIDTNGTTFENSEVQNFLNIYKDKVLFSISTDGCENCVSQCRKDINGNSAFPLIDKAIKRYINKYNEVPNTKLTISKDNIDYLFESYKYLYSLGFKNIKESVDISFIPDKEFLKKYRHQFLKTIKWIRDEAPDFTCTTLSDIYKPFYNPPGCGIEKGKAITIDAEGKLYSCFRFCKSSCGDKAAPIGNIQDGITDLTIPNAILKRLENTLPEKCQNCDIIMGCLECPADNYIYNNDFNKRFVRCELTKTNAKLRKVYEKIKNIPKV